MRPRPRASRTHDVVSVLERALELDADLEPDRGVQ